MTAVFTSEEDDLNKKKTNEKQPIERLVHTMNLKPKNDNNLKIR